MHHRRELFEDIGEAQVRCKKPILLKDLEWTCISCNLALGYKKYLLGEETWSASTYENYWHTIIAPGTSRSCLKCRGEEPAEATLECSRCGHLPKSAFSESDIMHVAKST